jgi:ABC-2 type transport system ATP-binding protein
MLGLTGAQFRPVREYSKGMQRRIGIAQALINDPEFLILDEPTTGLDPIGTKQIKDLIIELGRRGKTILLSSHLLADVEDCVDRLIILYGGQKRAEGTCDDLLVARDRTAIESSSLDDGTIAEIDRVIRQRTGDENAIIRVSKPRQSLEDLFLHIVEQAKAEQVATSGATAGGETASFLKGQDQGEELIDKLLHAEPEPVVDKKPEPARGPVVEKSVIADLLKPEAPPVQPVSPARPKAADQPKPGDVDLSVIGSLLDDGKDRGGGRKP